MDLDDEVNEKQNQKKKRDRETGRNQRRRQAGIRGGIEATERDIEIVKWLGRNRLATANQVMHRFELQRSKAYQRLGKIVDAGLARHEPGIRTSRVYLATRQGLVAAELDLPLATVSAASFAHDMAVVDVAIALDGSDTRPVLTEREIRRADARGKRLFRLPSHGAPANAQRGAWPDLVVIDRARRTMTAIEVELSLKKASRIHDKLIAYAGSRYKCVRYLCGSPAISAAVTREGARAGLGSKLEVEDLGRISGGDASSDELAEALDLLQQVRVQASDAASRARDAERRAEGEFRAGMQLVEQIAQYLVADRATQRATREHWQCMVDRRRRLEQTL